MTLRDAAYMMQERGRFFWEPFSVLIHWQTLIVSGGEHGIPPDEINPFAVSRIERAPVRELTADESIDMMIDCWCRG